MEISNDTNLIRTQFPASACTLSTVSTQNVVYFCLEKPHTFSFEVPKQGSLTRLEWKIDFEHSSRSSEASVTRLFTSADPEGHILRDSRFGVTFVFNLTSNAYYGSSSLCLVSVMSVANSG